MNIIETFNLTRKFNNLIAVDNLNVKIKQGELFSLLGPNGAGKTTTINILSTLLRPTKGTAKVNGYDIIKNPEKVRESIGVIFQETILDENLTALDNLKFYANLYKIPRSTRNKRIEELLKMLRLEDRKNSKVEKLSGGMKRKLELAMVLLNKPKVLFLDEPTLGLDPTIRRVIWDYILKLKKEETTIFLATHYMEEADYLSDRVAIINKGKIVVMNSPNKLKKSIKHHKPTLEDVFMHYVGELE